MDVYYKDTNTLSTIIQELENYPETMGSLTSLAILGVDNGEIIDAFSVMENPHGKPYTYKIFAVDNKNEILGKYRKIRRLQFVGVDFYDDLHMPQQVDMIYTEKFHLSYNPYRFISNANRCMTDGGILCFNVATLISTEYNRITHISSNDQPFAWTIPGLIYMLASNGFECTHFRKNTDSIDVLVYKKTDPMDRPTCYELSDRGLLTDSMKESVLKHGVITDEELVITWIDGRNELASVVSLPNLKSKPS